MHAAQQPEIKLRLIRSRGVNIFPDTICRHYPVHAKCRRKETPRRALPHDSWLTPSFEWDYHLNEPPSCTGLRIIDREMPRNESARFHDGCFSERNSRRSSFPLQRTENEQLKIIKEEMRMPFLYLKRDYSHPDRTRNRINNE